MLTRLILLLCLACVTPAQVVAAENASPQIVGQHAYTFTDVPIADPIITASMDAAEEHWGVPVCKNSFTIVLERRTVSRLTDFRKAGGFGRMGECLRWLTQQVVVELPPRLLCRLVVHEIGHNLGHEHDSDPSSVMGPTLSEEEVVPACDNLAVPGMRLPTGKNIRWCTSHKEKCKSKHFRLYARAFNLRSAWYQDQITRAQSLKAQGL